MKSGINTFNIPSDQVTFEMISHGLSAKSQDQELGILIGDESYAGSRNYENLCESVKEVFDKRFVCPTHNLQGALKLLTTTMVKESNVVLSNSAFPRQMVMDQGGEFKNFELTFEWKVSEGGNSGVFYLAREFNELPIYRSAPIM